MLGGTLACPFLTNNLFEKGELPRAIGNTLACSPTTKNLTDVNNRREYIGLYGAQAIRGGNSSNRMHCGTSYVNLNNTPSNARWNNGVSNSY